LGYEERRCWANWSWN